MESSIPSTCLLSLFYCHTLLQDTGHQPSFLVRNYELDNLAHGAEPWAKAADSMDHGGELDKSFRPTSPWWVGTELALTILNTVPGVRCLPRCSVEVWARRPARQGWACPESKRGGRSDEDSSPACTASRAGTCHVRPPPERSDKVIYGVNA